VACERCPVTPAEQWRRRALAAEAQLAALGAPRGQVPYDRDPEVLAWARAHVLRCVKQRRSGQDTYHVERATDIGRRVAAAMLRDLVDGGKGTDGVAFLGAFDARKPQLSAELAEREAAP
jgi:hypothetical protein